MLLVMSDAGGEPLTMRREREVIGASIGETNLTVIEQAKLHDLITGLPQHTTATVVHFACHGSLDARLKELVRSRCDERGIDIPEDEELSRLCADTIRRVLAEPPPSDPVSLPLLHPDVLERRQLEEMEAGVVLHHPHQPPPAYQIVNPDGLAGLFNVLPSLKCVVLNACTSHLQGEEFLRQVQQVQYVISVRGRIRDDAALVFSKGFYSSLSHGHVEKAFAYGCASLKAMYGRAAREIIIEDEGGTPSMQIRPGREAEPPSPERFRFQLFIRIAEENEKDGLLGYLLDELKGLGLPVREEDIKV